MSRQLPSVQHWVVCQEVVEEPPVYQLIDVCYLYAFTSPAGFPRLDDPDALPPAAPQLTVFCRFFGGEGVVDLEVRLGWLDAREPHRPFQVDVRPYRIEFRPDEPVRDYVFRVPQVPFFGYGRYELALAALPETDGRGRPIPGSAADVLAIEYFTLVPDS